MAKRPRLQGLTIPIAVLAALVVFVGQVERSAAQQPGAPTRIRVFAPFGPGGLNAGIHVAARRSGECFTTSLASQGRADAWRCMTGNTILDPCYEGREGAATVLACPDSPWSGNIILLTLTKPLPGGNVNGDEMLTSLPWALELAGGVRCQYLTGATGGVAGMRINYGCTGRGGFVLGDVDRSLPRWRVFLQMENSFAAQQEEVVTAWY